MPRAPKAAAGKKAGGPVKRSKLYAMPEKVPVGTVLTEISKKQWCVGHSIGTGGFGEIYTACRVGEKNYDFVVKCEPHGNGPLFTEMHFYIRNGKLEDIQEYKRKHNLKSLGMPYMVGHGSIDLNGQKHRFIVMPRYGSDVARHFVANGKRLPEGTAYRLVLQIIDVYEFIHSCGYVHADLKGANMLLGLGKEGAAQIYLVDYGLASHYITSAFKPDPKKMHNGTIEYTSRDAHQGVATMRGDMEILGYNLIEWLGVELPWVRDKLLAVPNKVQQAKEEFMANVETNLKKLFPNAVPVAVSEFLKYVAKMHYNDKPDYEKCRKIFNNALKTLKIPNSGKLELEVKPSHNNNNSSPPTTSKAAKRKAILNDSSKVMNDASVDDDDDVIFEPKLPVKVAPHKGKLKTIAKTHTKTATSPRRNFLKSSPKKSPITSIHRKAHAPITPNRISPRNKQSSPTIKTVSNGITNSSGTPVKSVVHSKHTTPIAARAKINCSPAITLSGTRPGKTIINDSLTPNPRAGKTYEFNFELDVSVDANVVVNVKRKKKAQITTKTKASTPSGTPRSNEVKGDDDTPVTRVKIRKLAGDEDESSPRTPAVIVKKTKRFQSPR